MPLPAVPSVRRTSDSRPPLNRGRVPSTNGRARWDEPPSDGGAEAAEGSRRARPLGNTAASLPPKSPTPITAGQRRVKLTPDEQDEARIERRDRRYELRRGGRAFSDFSSVKGCGQTPITAAGGVGLRVSDGTDGHGRIAGYAGLATCGSVWVCPVCAAKIAAKRSADLEHVLNWAVDQGHTVALLTLTARHHAGQRLADLWDGIVGAWGAVTSGRPWAGETEEDFAVRLATWQTQCDEYRRGERARAPRGYRAKKSPVRSIGIEERWGLLGFARAVEATHGETAGWHPHLHVLMVLDGEQSEDCVNQLGEAIWTRWEAALNRRGLTALRGPGLDIRTSESDVAAGLGRYFTKALALETTMGYGKSGRGNRTPFQILADAVETYRADDIELWTEWQRASRGRRQLTWSANLRKLAQLGEELTDEQIVTEVVDDGEQVLFMDGQTWRAVLATRSETALLTLAERNGLSAAARWLTLHRLEGWFIGLWTKDGPIPDPALRESA